MSTVNIPESRCLGCGYKLDAISTPTGQSFEQYGAPEPGSLTVCLNCGAVMLVGDDFRPRGMTVREVTELSADTKTMKRLKRLVQCIHFVKASKG